jgi:hypothetical protein
VTRRSVTMGVLAPVLLAVGVLSVTFIDQVAGQTAPAEATATVSATATAAASSTCAGESAPALDQRLPFGTCMPAEDVESAVETAGTAIGSTNCEKNAGNPCIASSYFPTRQRACASSAVEKEGDWFVLKDTGDCNDCYKKMMPAYRR